MSYIDGFVAAVGDDQREAYTDYARRSAVFFRESGATRVAENCDFCLHTKLAKGEDPACVSKCRYGALAFGERLKPATLGLLGVVLLAIVGLKVLA